MEKLGEKLRGACPQAEDVVGKTPEEIFDLARGPTRRAAARRSPDTAGYKVNSWFSTLLILSDSLQQSAKVFSYLAIIA